MKVIIMQQTIPLLCSSPEEVNKLLESGFEIKETENKTQYLIKDL